MNVHRTSTAISFTVSENEVLSTVWPPSHPGVWLRSQHHLYIPMNKSVCAQLCLTLCNPWTSACQVPSVHGIFQGVGCHALFQGIFLTQGSNPRLLCLLLQQADSLPLPCPGSLLWIQEHITLPPFLKWASEPSSSSWGQYGNQDLDPIQADSETHACSHNVSVPPWLYRRMEMKKEHFQSWSFKKKNPENVFCRETHLSSL